MYLRVTYKSSKPRRAIMRISVCLDRTQKQLNRLQNFFSLFQTEWSLLCLNAVRLNFTRVKSNNG